MTDETESFDGSCTLDLVWNYFENDISKLIIEKTKKGMFIVRVLE